MIRKLALKMLFPAVLALAAAGCVNVKVPEGPYVTVAEENAPVSDKTHEQMDAFLRQARDDGIISDLQYKKLKERLYARHRSGK